MRRAEKGKSEKPALILPGFIVEGGSTEFVKLRWVLRAMSRDHTRYMLQGVLIDEKANAVATDGCRMHIWRNCPLSERGFFRAFVGGKAIFLLPAENQFPRWEKLIPKRPPLRLAGLHLDSPKTATFSPELFRLYQATGACFNLNYLAAVGSFAVGLEWSVYGDEKRDAFLFRAMDLQAVVMPMEVFA